MPAASRANVGDTKLGQHIRAGEFGAAAALFQSEVDTRPLDRDARLILGKLYFADRNFDAALREFETIERRGGTKDDFRVIDVGELVGLGFSASDSFVFGSRFKDSASWLYLADLRLRGVASGPPLGPTESIRTLLRGESTIEQYVDVQAAFMDAALIQFGRDYGAADGVKEAVEVGRRNLRSELICIAHFALGEQAQGGQNAAVAVRHYRDAVTANADRIIEYHIAKAELKRLG